MLCPRGRYIPLFLKYWSSCVRIVYCLHSCVVSLLRNDNLYFDGYWHTTDRLWSYCIIKPITDPINISKSHAIIQHFHDCNLNDLSLEAQARGIAVMRRTEHLKATVTLDWSQVWLDYLKMHLSRFTPLNTWSVSTSPPSSNVFVVIKIT